MKLKNIFIGIIIILLTHNMCYSKIKGYKLGLITHKRISNYTETKNIKGGLLGIETSSILLNNKFLYPSTLNNIVGGSIGIQVSHNFIETEEEVASIVGKEIIFLREIYYALTTNILSYLNSFPNPEKEEALENHISYLEKLDEEESKKISILETRITNLETNKKTEEKKLNELEKKFFYSFSRYKAKESEKTILEFINLSQKNTITKSYLNALKKIQEHHNLFHPKLIKRIKAIKANKEPLIKGIKVVEIEDIDLGLIIK